MLSRNDASFLQYAIQFSSKFIIFRFLLVCCLIMAFSLTVAGAEKEKKKSNTNREKEIDIGKIYIQPPNVKNKTFKDKITAAENDLKRLKKEKQLIEQTLKNISKKLNQKRARRNRAQKRRRCV